MHGQQNLKKKKSSGQCQFSGFIENVTFRRVNLFPSSGGEDRWGYYFVGPASALSNGADKAGSLSLLPCLSQREINYWVISCFNKPEKIVKTVSSSSFTVPHWACS